MDNYLARLHPTRDGVREVEILPISGRANDLSQSLLLEGEDATALLQDIQTRTRALNTAMEIRGNVGIIRP